MAYPSILCATVIPERNFSIQIVSVVQSLMFHIPCVNNIGVHLRFGGEYNVMLKKCLINLLVRHGCSMLCVRVLLINTFFIIHITGSCRLSNNGPPISWIFLNSSRSTIQKCKNAWQNINLTIKIQCTNYELNYLSDSIL